MQFLYIKSVSALSFQFFVFCFLLIGVPGPFKWLIVAMFRTHPLLVFNRSAAMKALTFNRYLPSQQSRQTSAITVKLYKRSLIIDHWASIHTGWEMRQLESFQWRHFSEWSGSVGHPCIRMINCPTTTGLTYICKLSH